MAIGSGLGASVGVAPEVTYGTYVAPTRFYEFASESFKRTTTFVQGGGIAAGSYTRRGARRTLAAQAAEGDIKFDVPDRGFGLLLNNLLGGLVGPTQQATSTAYMQTHTIADNYGKSLTAQVGIPQTDGTVQPYTFLGGKIQTAEFSCAVGELLNVTLGFDFRQASEAQTLAAPSYVAGIGNFSFIGMSLRSGAVGSEVATDGVTGVKLTINRAMKTDMQYAGTGSLKAQPVTNDYIEITGEVTADFADKAEFADRFANGTSTSLVWEFIGSAIDGTYDRLIRFTMPMSFFDGDTPAVSGPDVVGTTYPFTVLDNGTNPVVTVEYQSTDTAI